MRGLAPKALLAGRRLALTFLLVHAIGPAAAQDQSGAPDLLGLQQIQDQLAPGGTQPGPQKGARHSSL